jgi:selenocysteine-specific elongation factor
VAAENVLVEAAAWARAVERAAALVDDAHRAYPEHAGLSLTDLRNALKKEFPFDDLFDAVVAGVCERGFSRAGSIIHRVAHRAQLPEPLRAAGDALRQALAAQPLDPPARKQLAPDVASQRALRFLIETGEIVEISPDLVLSAASVAQASAQVGAFLGEQGPATVSELRQVVGASRRIVVPLLEYLDRTFVTRRQGDKRTLR